MPQYRGSNSATSPAEEQGKTLVTSHESAISSSFLVLPKLSAIDTASEGETFYEGSLNGQKVAFNVDPTASHAFMSLCLANLCTASLVPSAFIFTELGNNSTALIFFEAQGDNAVGYTSAPISFYGFEMNEENKGSPLVTMGGEWLRSVRP